MINNDSPIVNPSEDLYNFSPFADAIARAIRRTQSPDGTVIAINGAWGSGKSSVSNLIRFHLENSLVFNEVKILDFNPWWYDNDEAITKAFFHHLYTGLAESISPNARSTMMKLSKKLLGAGQVISALSDLVAPAVVGKVLDKAASIASEYISDEHTAEQDYRLISVEMEKQKFRLLIIIDDIDRLLPEQALLVFRLVKSIGRLPNVIYMLLFDRELAERQLNERYPSERNFLEKIVQATFEIPSPDPSILHSALLSFLLNIDPNKESIDSVVFRNVLIDVVNPLVVLPRDLGRLISTINISYAAIGDEVNLADLTAIEALRLFRVSTYQSIRTNKARLLSGWDNYRGASKKDVVAWYDATFLASAKDDQERVYLQTALRRLFPQLDSIWSNVHRNYSAPGWKRERRICDPGHFPTYFRLTLGSDVLPVAILRDFRKNIDSVEDLKRLLRQNREVIRKDGTSNIPLLLEEFQGFAEVISNDEAKTLLRAIFEIADELDIPQDSARGSMGVANNHLRIHWLINSLMKDKMTQDERGIAFREIVPHASLGWSIDITRRLHIEHHPRPEGNQVPPELRIVDSDCEIALTQQLLSRIRTASSHGTLHIVSNLLSALYEWKNLVGGQEGHDEVIAWTNTQLDRREFLFRVMAESTSLAWQHTTGFDGMGDRVSRSERRVHLDPLRQIIDVEQMIDNINALSEAENNADARSTIDNFYEGINNVDKNPLGRPF